MAMRVKTVKDFLSQVKTVGYIHNRDRLGHSWVPAMVLNVQSNILNKKLFTKAYEIIK